MSGYQSNEGLAEWLATSPELRAVLESKVNHGKEFAEAIAPVGDPEWDWYKREGHAEPGTYKDSFHADVSVSKVAKGHDRLVGHLSNSAPHAAAVEYGYSGRHDSPGRNAHHVLTRAIDAMWD